MSILIIIAIVLLVIWILGLILHLLFHDRAKNLTGLGMGTIIDRRRCLVDRGQRECSPPQ